MLSKGQRRWVLASLALASRPDLLLMDEPAEGLDPTARRELFDLLREFVNTTSTTVVISSHILSDLERVADEIVVMQHGRILLHDALETLREEIVELELPENCPEPEWFQSVHDETVQVIARKQSGGLPRLWLRVRERNSGDSTVHDKLRGLGQLHRVNLESLYLALTNE